MRFEKVERQFLRERELQLIEETAFKVPSTQHIKDLFVFVYYTGLSFIRRIKYYDAEKDIRLVFLTNDFELDAIQIASICKSRWQIEVFFKWIKQNLEIKTLWGHSENAVKTQLWIAISTYLIVA